jgi:hypothetical protein
MQVMAEWNVWPWMQAFGAGWRQRKRDYERDWAAYERERHSSQQHAPKSEGQFRVDLDTRIRRDLKAADERRRAGLPPRRLPEPPAQWFRESGKANESTDD